MQNFYIAKILYKPVPQIRSHNTSKTQLISGREKYNASHILGIATRHHNLQYLTPKHVTIFTFQF